jgi:hypothetical protein
MMGCGQVSKRPDCEHRTYKQKSYRNVPFSWRKTVQNLGNRLGDAHGKGKRSVKRFPVMLNWRSTWPEAWRPSC